jgi:hypothetical protein
VIKTSLGDDKHSACSCLRGTFDDGGENLALNYLVYVQDRVGRFAFSGQGREIMREELDMEV